MSITGDQVNFTAVQKFGVTMHNFPQVLDTQLADKAGIINAFAQSGKRLGGQVMVVDSLTDPKKAAVYIASGSSDVSPWVVSTIVLGSGQVSVTPA